MVALVSCSCSWFFVCCFFVKQKAAYEMRISDWSSDVCSSDLAFAAGLDVGLDLRALKAFDCGGNLLVAAPRRALAGDAHIVVRREGEGLRWCFAGVDLLDHQRGDIDEDILVVDRRNLSVGSAHRDLNPPVAEPESLRAPAL